MNIEEIILAKKLAGGSSPSVDIEQLNVTENGTYSEAGKAYSPVIVEVPAPTLKTKTITENGTYNASDDNADGYSQVTVAVDGFKKKSIANTPTDIASFNDGTANPMPSLEISIVPVQSGSGDPSPSNVRPISGWSGANVTRVGKNLINISDAVVTSASYLFNGNISLPAGKYVFSITKADTVPYGDSVSIAIVMDNGTNATVYNTATEGNKRIIYLEAINKIATIRVYVVAGDYRDIQLELGSTATSYTPYNGSTSSIPFRDSSDNPITVYGGVLNVTSGELTANEIGVVYNGSESGWTWTDMYKQASISLPSIAKYRASQVTYKCNRLAPIANESRPSNIGNFASLISNGAGSAFSAPNCNTLSEFTSWLVNNNVQFVYKLETPQTYQLTPAQVTTLLEQNNIFADCGQILQGEYFVAL